MCDVIPLSVDSHIIGVGKPMFGRNRDPTVVLASGHFYNWLEVAANYYTSQIARAIVSVCVYVYIFVYTYVCMYCTSENLDTFQQHGQLTAFLVIKHYIFEVVITYIYLTWINQKSVCLLMNYFKRNL